MWMVAEKSNEIPTAPELIEALGLKDCLFTLDAEHCQKNPSNALSSRNHLLTQVKDNQKNLRRRLELGAMGRKPSGCKERDDRPQSLGDARTRCFSR